MDIIEQRECNRIGRLSGRITREMFCAGDIRNGGVDTCQVSQEYQSILDMCTVTTFW